MRTSVIIPSRRYEATARVLGSLRETTSGLDVEPVVVTDQYTQVADVAISLGATVVYLSNAVGAIGAWNKGLAVSSGDMLVFAADDLLFHQDWLATALRAHANMGGYGLVGFNDLGRDGSELSTHFMYDRKFCVEVLGGVMAFPHYRFYCNDNESNERAKRAGHFHWCEQSIVEHLHYSYGLRPIDKHDAAVMLFMPGDVQELNRRRRLEFPNDFKPVIT